MLTPWKESYDQPRQHVKKQRHYFANKGLSSQSYIFSSSYVWKELDYKESWAPKNGYFWTAVLDKTLESPLGCKEIKPLNPKGNQSWIFIGRTDAEAEASVLCPLEVKSQLIGKGPEAGKDWRQKKKWMTGWDGWTASPTQWTSLSKHGEIVKDREVWHAAVLGVTTTWSNNTISGHIPRDKHGSKGYMHPSVLCSIVIIVKRWK